MAMTGTVLKRSDFNGTNGSKFELVLTYTYSQDSGTQKTTIVYRNYFRSKDYYSGGGSTVTAYINGSSVGTCTSISAGEEKLMGSKTVAIAHNADGTFPATNYTASIDTPWTIGDASVSGKFNAGAFPAFSVTTTINYFANGGINTPVSQSKAGGATVNITSEVPTKVPTTGTTYTVTFNGNNGTPDVSSLTSNLITFYNFNNWNTAADGSGTSYASGASYSTNAELLLYAQYTTGTTQRELIKLPGACRSGYRLKGWGTSASATTGVSNPYTPTGNVTLYAIWEANNSQVRSSNGSSWSDATVINAKVGNEWKYVGSQIKTNW